MAYEIYKKALPMDAYFATWDSVSYKRLTEELKKRIFEKYQMKCEVFQRDEFRCQNIECESQYSQLTVHHVKFQKNGGRDSARNCVTLCRSCHQAFHRGKRKISFADVDTLPSHIRGRTFQVTVDDTIDWKKVKAEMKILRKNLINARVYLTWEDIALLMKFLEFNFTDDDD